MTASEVKAAVLGSSKVMNLPNQLTSVRLALSLVLIGLIHFDWYWASFWVFLVAATTDWLDGYLARKYNLVTMLGRILDPFVDKIIMCGTFISLAAKPGSGVEAWLAVVIMGREMLVTALRSFLEQQGADFSASLAGKLKMVIQCVAAALSLFCLARKETSGIFWLALVVSVWASLAITIYSGAGYVRKAIGLLKGSS